VALDSRLRGNERRELLRGVFRGRDLHGFAAAAGAGLIWIIEDELGRQFFGLIVHLGAEQEKHGLRIDQDLDALVLDNFVDGLIASAYSMVYSWPAQPPFLTPTRTPAIGRSARAITSLMRNAAASVSRITWVGVGALPWQSSFGLYVVFLPETCSHHILSTSRASSDIRLGSQGGSHTTVTLVSLTPGTLETAFSTMIGSSCADGQLGDVSDISIFTARSSPISIL